MAGLRPATGEHKNNDYYRLARDNVQIVETPVPHMHRTSHFSHIKHKLCLIGIEQNVFVDLMARNCALQNFEMTSDFPMYVIQFCRRHHQLTTHTARANGVICYERFDPAHRDELIILSLAVVSYELWCELLVCGVLELLNRNHLQ